MSERREWFAPKRFGYGAGLPISWQGSVVTLLFIAASILAAILFDGCPVRLAAVLVPAVVLFGIVTHRTTRAGWRWRWGERD